MNAKKIITSALIAAMALGTVTGCSSMRAMVIEDTVKDTKDGKDKEKLTQFEARFEKVLDDIDNKKDYKKLPTDDTEKTKWFIKESFKLWDKQITRDEYIAAGIEKYGGYKETMIYLADEFSN